MCAGCNKITIDGVTYHQSILTAGNCPSCCFYNPEGNDLETACGVSADNRFDCTLGAFKKECCNETSV